jgi:hypothetical protein
MRLTDLTPEEREVYRQAFVGSLMMPRNMSEEQRLEAACSDAAWTVKLWRARCLADCADP